VATNSSLQLVKEKTQLHANDEARHAQEDVAPQLKFARHTQTYSFTDVQVLYKHARSEPVASLEIGRVAVERASSINIPLAAWLNLLLLLLFSVWLLQAC